MQQLGLTERSRTVLLHWSRDLLHWANIHHFYTTRRLKTGEICNKTASNLQDSPRSLSPKTPLWTELPADFRSFSTPNLRHSARELHWKLQIIEVLYTGTAYLRDFQLVNGEFRAKWSLATGSTNNKEVRSRHFQANWRTIFLSKILLSHGFVTLIRINGDQICLKYTGMTVY